MENITTVISLMRSFRYLMPYIWWTKHMLISLLCTGWTWKMLSCHQSQNHNGSPHNWDKLQLCKALHNFFKWIKQNLTIKTIWGHSRKCSQYSYLDSNMYLSDSSICENPAKKLFVNIWDNANFRGLSFW